MSPEIWYYNLRRRITNILWRITCWATAGDGILSLPRASSYTSFGTEVWDQPHPAMDWKWERWSSKGKLREVDSRAGKNSSSHYRHWWVSRGDHVLDRVDGLFSIYSSGPSYVAEAEKLELYLLPRLYAARILGTNEALPLRCISVRFEKQKWRRSHAMFLLLWTACFWQTKPWDANIQSPGPKMLRGNCGGNNGRIPHSSVQVGWGE